MHGKKLHFMSRTVVDVSSRGGGVTSLFPDNRTHRMLSCAASKPSSANCMVYGNCRSQL